MCTAIAPSQAKHVKHTVATANPVYTALGNRFPAPVVIDTKGQEMVCVPTKVQAVSPAP